MHKTKMFWIVLLANAFFCSMSSATDTLTVEQKVQALASLDEYENSADKQPSKEQLKQLSSDAEVPKFKCSTASDESCEMQEFLYKMENRKPPVFISDGKYKVSVSFISDGSFPTKYAEKPSFESVPEEAVTQVENEIFEHFLGLDHAQLKPELIAAYKSVVSIAIYVESSSELNRFISDQRVRGIHHIGNDKDVEEGYH